MREHFLIICASIHNLINKYSVSRI